MGDQKYPFDLAIATTTYFGPYVHVESEEKIQYRISLFRKLVASLDRTQWGGIRACWCISDDNSPTKVPVTVYTKRYPTVWGKKITGDINVDNIAVYQSSRTNGPSQNANVVDNLNNAQTMAPFTVCIDSDALVHPLWVLKAFELIEKYPNSPLYGLYNSKHHPTIDYTNYKPDDADTVFKHSNTVFGTLFHSESRGRRSLNEWCEQFVWRSPENTPIIPVLRKSVIQHTGLNGLNSVEGVTDPDYDSTFEE